MGGMWLGTCLVLDERVEEGRRVGELEGAHEAVALAREEQHARVGVVHRQQHPVAHNNNDNNNGDHHKQPPEAR